MKINDENTNKNDQKYSIKCVNDYFDQQKKEEEKYKMIIKDIITGKKGINYETPKLKKFKLKPLYKKNNKIFLSPIHFKSVEALKEIQKNSKSNNKMLEAFDDGQDNDIIN